MGVSGMDNDNPSSYTFNFKTGKEGLNNMATKKTTSTTKKSRSTSTKTKTTSNKSTSKSKSTKTSTKGTATNGGWKTINGTHVFIENGKITKGPKNLVGKTKSGAMKEMNSGKKSTTKGNSDKKTYDNLNKEIRKARTELDDSQLKKDQTERKLLNTYLKEKYGRTMSGISPKYREVWDDAYDWVHNQKDYKDLKSAEDKNFKKFASLRDERNKVKATMIKPTKGSTKSTTKSNTKSKKQVDAPKNNNKRSAYKDYAKDLKPLIDATADAQGLR